MCATIRRGDPAAALPAGGGDRAGRAGGIALALRRSLRWDPALGAFAGDDAANRLLAYSPRPPWGI